MHTLGVCILAVAVFFGSLQSESDLQSDAAKSFCRFGPCQDRVRVFVQQPSSAPSQ